MISSRRYKNVSKVFRAGLRLLEEEENKLFALRTAIQEGIESGIADDFNPVLHLEEMKTNLNQVQTSNTKLLHPKFK